MRTPGWTDRPAINLGRLHANKENAIEPPIPSTERFIILVRIHGKQYRSPFGGCLAVFGHVDFSGCGKLRWAGATTLGANLDGTYRTNGTYGPCHIDPISPIGPIRVFAPGLQLECALTS